MDPPLIMIPKVNSLYPPNPVTFGQQPKRNMELPRPQFGILGLLNNPIITSIATPIEKLMFTIEANKATELMVSDVGAMVLPRTLLDGLKRGPIPAQETFLREAAGTIGNVYIAGWIAWASAFVLNKVFAVSRYFNPKGMDMRAWVNANTLSHYDEITHRVIESQLALPQSKRLSIRGLRREIVSQLLNLQSEDPVRRLKEYSHLPQTITSNGKSELLKMLLPTDGETLRNTQHRAYNIEGSTQKRLERSQQEILSTVEFEQEQYLAKKGLKKASRIPNRVLQKLSQIKKTIEHRFHLLYRSETTSSIRHKEDAFFNRMYKVAIQEGLLTDEVNMLDHTGKPSKLGTRKLEVALKDIKYFTEEFLNRALTHLDPKNREVSKLTTLMTDEQLLVVKRALWGTPKAKTFLQSILPQVGEGMFKYAYKLKRWITGGSLAISVFLGGTYVLFNNWLTRSRLGGQRYFPGEQAFVKTYTQQKGEAA